MFRFSDGDPTPSTPDFQNSKATTCSANDRRAHATGKPAPLSHWRPVSRNWLSGGLSLYGERPADSATDCDWRLLWKVWQAGLGSLGEIC